MGKGTGQQRRRRRRRVPVSKRNVLGCVQLVNKFDGPFNAGDEETVEQLCVFLNMAFQLDADQHDIVSVSQAFEAWSIKQRMRLKRDAAYGSIVEVFLEQASLLTGAQSARFVLKYEVDDSEAIDGAQSKKTKKTRQKKRGSDNGGGGDTDYGDLGADSLLWSTSRVQDDPSDRGSSDDDNEDDDNDGEGTDGNTPISPASVSEQQLRKLMPSPSARLRRLRQWGKHHHYGLHEWHGSCRYAVPVKSKAVAMAVKQAWGGPGKPELPIMVVDHLGDFEMHAMINTIATGAKRSIDEDTSTPRNKRAAKNSSVGFGSSTRSRSDSSLLDHVVCIPLRYHRGRVEIVNGQRVERDYVDAGDESDDDDSNGDDGAGAEDDLSQRARGRVSLSSLSAAVDASGKFSFRKGNQGGRQNGKRRRSLVRGGGLVHPSDEVERDADGHIVGGERSVVVLQFDRRPSKTNFIEADYLRVLEKVVRKLFRKFGKALHERELAREGTTHERLAHVRAWVRQEMHRQAKEQLVTLQVQPAQRQIGGLKHRIEDLEKESDRLRAELSTCRSQQRKAEESVEDLMLVNKDLLQQRDILADQLAEKLAEDTSKAAAARRKAAARKAREDEQEREDLRRRLEASKLERTRLETELHDMRDERAAEHEKIASDREARRRRLQSEKDRAGEGERYLKGCVERMCRKVDNPTLTSFRDESADSIDASMLETPVSNLREQVLEALTSVLDAHAKYSHHQHHIGSGGGGSGDMVAASKAMVAAAENLSVSLSAAEIQLRFLPRCREELTAAKKHGATLQSRIGQLVRSQDHTLPKLSYRLAERHWRRKVLGKWRLVASSRLARARRQEKQALMLSVAQLWREHHTRRYFTQWKDRWDSSQATRRATRRALACFFRKRLWMCMLGWKHFVRARKRGRVLCARVMARAGRRLEAAAIRTWRITARAIAGAEVRRATLMRRAAAMFRRGSLVRAFRQWSARLGEKRRADRLLRRGILRLTHRTATACFNQWRNFCDDRDRARVQMARIIGMLSNKSVARAWRKWCNVHTENERERASGVRVLKRWLQSSLHKSFTTWREAADEAKRERYLIHRATVRFTHRRIAAAFHAWWHTVDDLIEARRMLHRILTRWDRKQETAALRQWRMYAAFKRKKEEVANRVLRRWLGETKQRSFLRWKTNSQEQRIERQLVKRAMARFTQRHVASCFHGWVHAVDSLVEARHLLRRIFTRASRKAEARAMRRWHGFLTLKKRQDAIAARVVARWQVGNLARSFAQWRERAAAHKVERRLILRATVRFTHRHIATCFHGWHHAVQERVRDRQLARRALTKFTHGTLSRSFHAWSRLTRDVNRGRAITTRILTRWDRKHEVNAMRKWREFVVVCQKQEQVVDRILFRWRAGLLHRSFNRWQHNAVTSRTDRQLARRALARFVHNSLHSAFRAWSAMVEGLQHARTITIRILTRWDRKAEVSAFRKWVAHTRVTARQDAVIDRILFRWRSGLLHRSFNRWQHHAYEQRMDRQLARRALTRFTHRTIHRCFHAWVQMLTDLEHARLVTQRILNRWDRKAEVSAFRQWVTHTRLLSRQQAVAGRILWRWSQMSLHRSWNRWRDNAHGKRVARQLTHKAAVRYTRRTLSKALQRWRTWAVQWTAAKDGLRGVVRLFGPTGSSLRRLCLLHWRGWVRHLNTREDALYRIRVVRYGRRLLRLAWRRWTTGDECVLWGREIRVRAGAAFRRSRALRSALRGWRVAVRRAHEARRREESGNVRAARHVRRTSLRRSLRRVRAHALRMRARKLESRRALRGIWMCERRRRVGRAFAVWLQRDGAARTRTMVATGVLAPSIVRRRQMRRLRESFASWSMYVRRALWQKHAGVVERFRKAGLRGRLAEVQWVMGKWQQFAACVRHRAVTKLEQEHFLHHIRAENAKLRKTLLEYHKRGMFVLDGSKDYLVQRKIAPDLKADDYDDLDAMIAGSYQFKVPVGVKVDAPGGPAFGRHGPTPRMLERKISSRDSSRSSRTGKQSSLRIPVATALRAAASPRYTGSRGLGFAPNEGVGRLMLTTPPKMSSVGGPDGAAKGGAGVFARGKRRRR